MHKNKEFTSIYDLQYADQNSIHYVLINLWSYKPIKFYF